MGKRGPKLPTLLFDGVPPAGPPPDDPQVPHHRCTGARY